MKPSNSDQPLFRYSLRRMHEYAQAKNARVRDPSALEDLVINRFPTSALQSMYADIFVIPSILVQSRVLAGTPSGSSKNREKTFASEALSGFAMTVMFMAF